MLVDTHAHLDDEAFAADLPDVLRRAREAGITRIITVGTDLDSSRKACDLAAAHPGLSAAIGSHPHTADTVSSLEEFRPLLARAVAIGETGLDYAKKFATVENQKRLFIEHMKLVRETGLPIILHCRDAHPDCRALLREHLGTSLRGVVHCFSGDAADARDYLDLGLHLSFAGPVTFPKAQSLREVAAKIPLDRILLETDCPLLAPQRWRGKRNEPAYVVHTAEIVAAQLRLSLEQLAQATTCNAENLFSRS